MMKQRERMVWQMQQWVGKNEARGTHKEIIDIFNRKVGGMKYTWPWCAVTVSSAAISTANDTLVPLSMSCEGLISKAQKMGIWVEDDSYNPREGDIILYDWTDNGIGDSHGESHHVGVVENNVGGVMTIIEGNKNDAVGRRVLRVNGRYIRGYIVPKYESLDSPTVNGIHEYLDKIKPQKSLQEVAEDIIMGLWGSGDDRRIRLTKAGYDYNEVQRLVNNRLRNRKSYVVKNGDTLYKIAKAYATTVEELQRINRLNNPNLIHVGDKLWI